MFNFLKKAGKKKSLPFDLQLDIQSGKFDTKQVLKIISGYDLSSHELNIIGIGFKNKKEFGLTEKYFIKSLKKDKSNSDAYGNLISLYCEQKKYNLCEKTYLSGIKNAGRGREFIYYHQARALFNQKKYNEALKVGLLGIEEKDDELTYILCIKALMNIAKIFQQANKNELAKDPLIMASSLSQIAIKAFPESKEIKELYKFLCKKK